jgi:hypothetical protein
MITSLEAVTDAEEF